MTRFIFVTGGVGLILARIPRPACLGAILEARRSEIGSMKLDLHHVDRER